FGHELVEGRMDEVGELDLGDGPQAADRRPDRRADDLALAQWRVDDAIVAELRPQPVGRKEDAALLADVLAEHDHALVSDHLLAEPLADGFDERLERHQPARPARPMPVTPPGPMAAAPQTANPRRRPTSSPSRVGDPAGTPRSRWRRRRRRRWTP